MSVDSIATTISNLPEECEGFDKFAGRRWIYPNNMPVRGYQKLAVEKALFHNAMIVLPTGMGKTFIAAVVMYNFYRWYPQGKLIFVAPTRPLVTQQIVECKKISGIPGNDCIELTGHIPSDKRKNYWKDKRVFFATPQVIENDLDSDILPATDIKCLVIDEAHRAQGSYAYVGIVKQLHERSPNKFRILALSATPGSDIARVQQVMLNLLISEVVFRTEGAIDLMQFKNEKTSKAWQVNLTGKHKEFVDRFIKLTSPIYKEIYKAGLTFSADSIDRVAKYLLVKAITGPNNGPNGKIGGKLRLYLNAALSLTQQFELLTLYGIRTFYSSITRAFNEPRSAMKTALIGSVDLDKILQEIRDMFGQYVEPDVSKAPKSDVDLIKGHPKLFLVKDLLMKHFQANHEKKETRAIVFTKYRESVFDIVQTLRAFDPVIRPGCFVGQGSASKSGIGMKQKEQLQMIQEFKAGKYNVMVATCVAEEGLDIGEVDLIICYDTTSSPISNTQRRGRTGRKRCGDVHTLVTQGYEEKKLKKAGFSKRQVEEQLYKRENYMNNRYRNAPRMIPKDITPVCLEQKIFPDPGNQEEEEEEPKKKRQRVTKQKNLNDFAFNEKEKDKCKKGREDKKEMEMEGFTCAKDLLVNDEERDEKLDDDEELRDERTEDDEVETITLQEDSPEELPEDWPEDEEEDEAEIVFINKT